MSLWSLDATTLDDPIANYEKSAYIKALDSFYTLAKEGDAIAQHNLAIMYATSKGAKADKTKAMHWYEKAAKQNYTLSAYNLGELYQSRGREDSHDYNKAKYWYEKP